MPQLSYLKSFPLQRFSVFLGLPRGQSTFSFPSRYFARELGELLLALLGILFSVRVDFEGTFAVLVLDQSFTQSRSCLVQHLFSLPCFRENSIVLFRHRELLSLVVNLYDVVFRPVEGWTWLRLYVVLLESLLLNVASTFVFER